MKTSSLPKNATTIYRNGILNDAIIVTPDHAHLAGAAIPLAETWLDTADALKRIDAIYPNIVTQQAIKVSAKRWYETHENSEFVKKRGTKWLVRADFPPLQKWIVKAKAAADSQKIAQKAQSERKAAAVETAKYLARINTLETDNDTLRNELNAAHDCINKRDARIAELEAQLAAMRVENDKLRYALDTVRGIISIQQTPKTPASKPTKHTETSTAPTRSNRPKRTSAEQAAKDEATLQGWEKWQQEHDNPQVKDYAESLGRKRTTVNGQLARARRNRENQQENSTTE